MKINNETEYEEAVAKLLSIFKSSENAQESEELFLAISEYEDTIMPLEDGEPLDEAVIDVENKTIG
ncbi:MAG: hypothetical protein IPO45_02375 [Saprospiraceae bacterium]|jgi:hypothetical protein|uniref:hypothetical protein n=1 Tax=Candidatus Brachybacter algidus TaxID=2982024 RepID=UPI001B699708|nr:hypothetical protein [Candidatus Brachybacter algidus]MBP7306455.1 hypothetical protein [Saprospiraceae bacterium]MBK6373686.1 hypothetical protein [Candidatus Brachybacter algidus]MBK6450853.1 hypothetical protein [Candidatus Brachybacter algidus]MBK7604961.1 hypothetical protein [Candidatus Brachybacter algidus]MBK8354998.1 hypothetical protein [Candidatus Brachybacter algidus]